MSLDRGRLSYFGTREETHNLLYAPSGPDLAQLHTWGGHRFWLGPQKSWARNWPPPSDWELAPSRLWHVSGAKLFLTVSHNDPSLPQLYREYDWDGAAFRVNGAWSGGQYQAIHIFQLPVTASVEVSESPTKKSPQGFALLPIGSRKDIMLHFAGLPLMVDKIDKGKLRVQNIKVEEKLGFSPQTLVVKEGEWGFLLERGPIEGTVVRTPDHGFLSQVYVGDALNPYLEAEQLSPVLASGSKQLNAFSVTLVPFRY